MPFALVEYEKLKAALIQSIGSLLNHHQLDPTKVPESLILLETISPVRSMQASFLRKIYGTLDEEHPEKAAEIKVKTRTLNAAAYYIWQKIEATYTWLPAEWSDFYKSLTSALNLTKENMPDDNDLSDMYSDLEKHLRKHTYINARPRRGYLEVQVFKIPGYSVEGDLLDLGDKLNVLRNKEIRAAQVKHVEENRKQEEEEKKQVVDDKKSAKPSSGGMFGGTKATKSDKAPTTDASHVATSSM